VTRLILAVTVLCAIVWPLAAQQPTFSSKRESVRLDVLVTDRGRPVRDLKAEDFEVFDSGVAQQIDFVSVEQLPINVVLALDSSTSISPEQFEHLRDGGRAVLAALKGEDQAALLTFADAVALRGTLTADLARVRAALGEMQAPSRNPHGGTALIDACYTALMVADADAYRALLLAFTDGVDTSSWLTADAVLQAARRSNLVAYAVSTSDLPDSSFLHKLSDVTGGVAFEIASTADLRAAFLRIIDEFRQRYLVSYSPLGVPNAGWHPVTVRVKGRKVDVKARAGYIR
jgi:Ca-activated chloride channel family protein